MTRSVHLFEGLVSKLLILLISGVGFNAVSGCGACTNNGESSSESIDGGSGGGGGGGGGGGAIPTAPWAKQLGNTATVPGGDVTQYEGCFSTAVDGDGNVYCAGLTNGALGEAAGGGGQDDAFVMKLNSSRVVQWIRQLGATTAVPGGNTAAGDTCKSVAVDGSGNVYCAGYTQGSLGEANGGGGNGDAFVMKLDSSGVVQWIRQLGATTAVPGGNTALDDSCDSVAVDGSGNVYCAGYTQGSLGEANAGGGNTDAFVVKLNSSGVVRWIRQLGATTAVPGGNTAVEDGCNSVAVGGSGNVYCAGYTQGSLGEANGGGGDYDAFVMKLDSSGVVQWIRQLGATTAVPGGNTAGWDFCTSVAVDGSGNVYCAGYTQGSLGEANGGGGKGDAFVMKLDSSGVVQWIRQLGATTAVPGGNTAGWDYCTSVAVGGSGNGYCAGHTSGSLGEANGGGGLNDAFAMKLDSSGVVQWIRQFGSTTKAATGLDNSNDEVLYGCAVDVNGTVYAAGEAFGDFADAQGGNTGNGDVIVVKIKADGTF